MMDGDLANRAQAKDLTRTLAQQASAVSYDALPEEVRALARQCVLDYYGVALAGADDQLVAILLDELNEAGGNKQAAARVLSVDRKTLDRMIKRHHIVYPHGRHRVKASASS